MKSFTILGTGWLGLSLAKDLNNEYKVKVSIRDEKKKNNLIKEGFFPSILNEENLDSLNDLLDTDYLFINFPPSKSKDYLLFLENIYSHEKIKNIKKIIFISSTSIYPNENNIFKEDYKIENSISKIVYEAEELIKEKTNVIFRCSGLMGENRIAGKYFANKNLDCKNQRVNYIHRDDIISAIKFVIEKNINGIFNLCSKEHPRKEEVYLLNAKKHNFEASIFINTKEYNNRIIDGSKIQSLGFEYKYPNPLEY